MYEAHRCIYFGLIRSHPLFRITDIRLLWLLVAPKIRKQYRSSTNSFSIVAGMLRSGLVWFVSSILKIQPTCGRLELSRDNDTIQNLKELVCESASIVKIVPTTLHFSIVGGFVTGVTAAQRSEKKVRVRNCMLRSLKAHSLSCRRQRTGIHGLGATRHARDWYASRAVRCNIDCNYRKHLKKYC